MPPNLTKYERFLLDASQPAKRYYIRILEALQAAHLAFSMSPGHELEIDMDLGGFGTHRVRVYSLLYQERTSGNTYAYVIKRPKGGIRWEGHLPSTPVDIDATLVWAQAMYRELFV